MLILHAAAMAGGLRVWGEAPPAPGRRAGRPPVPYPYDAGPDRLGQTLAEILHLPRAPELGSALLWCPSRGAVPVPSSPLVAAAPSSRARPRLAPWAVTVWAPVPAQVVDLLCACMGQQGPAGGLMVGADLAWWARAARLGGALVAAGHFLPGVAESAPAGGGGDGEYRARWLPVVQGEDLRHLADLTAALPPAALALTPVGAREPPAAAPEPALRMLLGLLVDHLVRSADPALDLPAPPARRRAAAFASLHEQWLYALRAADDTLVGAQEELQAFARTVAEWQRPVLGRVEAPLRLCFRLEEPATGEDADWYVRFLLQSVADPSLQLPLAEVWQGAAARWLRHPAVDARELALSALGQASRLCPGVEAGLRGAVPEGYALDAPGAYRFLTGDAALLRQAGYPVMLPAWWTGRRPRLSARARVRPPRLQAGAGLGEVLEFDWELALGEASLSLAELEALARLKAPLVRHRGQWVEVNPEEIRAALELWRRQPSGRASLGEVVRMELGAAQAPGGLDLAGVQAAGWVGELLERLRGERAVAELPPPPGFTATLRPYQLRGLSWLAFLRDLGLGACLADDMGLGKTVQTLALLQRDLRAGLARRPVLLICPTSVVSNWQREAARFAPELPVMVHHGATRNKRAAFAAAARDHALVVSSYALLTRDEAFLAQVHWGGLILDEAQNIKNPETRQARVARALQADYRIALTGTPVENHVGDLWSLMEFLNPGLLGSQSAFKRRFFIPIQARADAAATERLRRLTGPFILRRMKTDRSIIADLPEKQEMTVYCGLTREQASLYAAVLKEAEAALQAAEGMQRRGLILATLSRLKQVCNHPAQLLADGSAIPGRSGKLALLQDLLAEVLEGGERALVFTQFAQMGEILKRHLQELFGREVLFLHGGVRKPERDRMVERFQGEAGPPVFVLSLRAGGTGLNLTRASQVFHFDRWWNPAVEDQATDRAFRIGQTRTVQVRRFVCAGTFEERIDRMIADKKAVARQLVGAGEGWVTELSNAQLRELFALGRDAVGE